MDEKALDKKLVKLAKERLINTDKSSYVDHEDVVRHLAENNKKNDQNKK